MLFKTFLASTKVLPSSRPTEDLEAWRSSKQNLWVRLRNRDFGFRNIFLFSVNVFQKRTSLNHLIYYLQSSSSFKKILSRYFQRFYDFFFILSTFRNFNIERHENNFTIVVLSRHKYYQ